MNITINGVELQGDLMDADFIGPYEEATKHMLAESQMRKAKHYDTVAASYLEQCQVVDRYFDQVFGEGTAARVFQGKEHNVMTHLQAVEQLTNWAYQEKKKFNDFTNKYTQRQNAKMQRDRAQQIIAAKKNGGSQ